MCFGSRQTCTPRLTLSPLRCGPVGNPIASLSLSVLICQMGVVTVSSSVSEEVSVSKTASAVPGTRPCSMKLDVIVRVIQGHTAEPDCRAGPLLEVYSLGIHGVPALEGTPVAG